MNKYDVHRGAGKPCPGAILSTINPRHTGVVEISGKQPSKTQLKYLTI
jgi:hypothetical protein